MLKTKLNKPNLATKLIIRKEIIDKLESGNEKKLCLVSAPAGYGKSTLISQWIEQSKHLYSWYSLDTSDNDIVTFLRYLIAGIQLKHNTFGGKAIHLLESNRNCSYKTIATCIINDLCAIDKSFHIIFDDYHLIENKEINNLIYFLLDNIPAHVQVVLITRADPSIPLARLRSQQQVLDIRLADLCFNANNIYDFFNKSLNIHLSIDDAKSLESKTEGWIAGLQLTGLSLQGKEDISAFVAKLKGDNRYIMDYLVEEVLQQQPSEFRDFLLYTSILNRFNASLCNYMLNIDNSQGIIEQLEKNNMFIIPLDSERNWFRYHHLFTHLLQQKLTLQYKEKVCDLHLNASQWFEKNKLTMFAIEHSFNAGSKQKALSLIAGIIDNLWETSQYSAILKYGGMFSEEELITNVNFCIIYSWVLFESGNIGKSESLLLRLLEQTKCKNQLGRIYVCLNNLKAFTGDIDSAFKYSELATQNISEDDILWNALAHMSHGESHLLRLELIESLQSFNQAGRKASEANIQYLNLISQARASLVLWSMGNYAGGYKKSKDLLEVINSVTSSNGGDMSFLSSILYSIVGNYQVEKNEVIAGIQNSIRGYELSEKTNVDGLKGSCALMLADAYYKLGDYNKAIQIIEDLDTLPYKQTIQLLCILSDSLKSKLYILTNQQDKLKYLFEKDIEPGKTHAFEACNYVINKSRYKIAQGKYNEAIEYLQKITKDLRHKKAFGLLTEVELLKAIAYLSLQKPDLAIESLLFSIHQTQEVGLIRMYINEGKEIEILLKKIMERKGNRSDKQLDPIHIEYIKKILRVFKKENNMHKIIPDEELSSREMDTLKLVSENLSNQEIANELYVSVNTVKTHVRNILLKLEARNRNEAVIKAKEKGILVS